MFVVNILSVSFGGAFHQHHTPAHCREGFKILFAESVKGIPPLVYGHKEEENHRKHRFTQKNTVFMNFGFTEIGGYLILQKVFYVSTLTRWIESRASSDEGWWSKPPLHHQQSPLGSSLSPPSKIPRFASSAPIGPGRSPLGGWGISANSYSEFLSLAGLLCKLWLIVWDFFQARSVGIASHQDCQKENLDAWSERCTGLLSARSRPLVQPPHSAQHETALHLGVLRDCRHY